MARGVAYLVILLLFGLGIAAIELWGGAPLTGLLGDLLACDYRQPVWLWLLLLLIPLCLFSVRDTAGRFAIREWYALLRQRQYRRTMARIDADGGRLGPRAWLIILSRAGIVALVILALADPQYPREEDELTVLVVIDRSLSIPQEVLEGSVADARWERIKVALQQASRRPHRPTDRIGVISFARQPRLEYPAMSVPEVSLPPLGQGLDRNYTDIAAALRLALASFPQGSARRILLLSDGNENRGNALAEAQTAELNGVPVDVVPIKYTAAEEVIVDRVDLPSETAAGQAVPLRLLMHNYANRPVAGTLRITRSIGNQTEDAFSEKITIPPGPFEHFTQWPASRAQAGGLVVYRARFLPERLPRDRAENNETTAPVIISQSGRRYLVVHPPSLSKGQVEPLKAALQLSNAIPGNLPCTVDLLPSTSLPSDKDNRRFELANYDAIILFNVPADVVTKEQQEALRKSVRHQGTGLVVVGGTESFGAGRWQNEPLEDVLPLDTSIRSKKVQLKSGLVLIMHASEMPEGNHWQKEIAKLAVDKLGPQDEVGIIYWDYGINGGHRWHVDLQEVGRNRRRILSDIDTMSPGDMPQFDPAFTMATQALSDPKKQLGTRHVILISDGDHGLLQDFTLLRGLQSNKITLTTVGVTTHGPAAHQALERISRATGGKHHAVDNPEKLPAIYIQELKTLSQNYLMETTFRPVLTRDRGDPLLNWTKPFPPLHGFVRTTRKDPKEVQVLMEAPLGDGDDNPILAQWQRGLGRVVAFTSDAGGHNRAWARDWLQPGNQALFNEFWLKVVQWAQRNIEDTGLSLRARSENGRIRIHLVDNRSKEQREQRPLGNLKVTVSSSIQPDGKTVPLEPTAAGVYEAEVEGEAAGSYAVTVTGVTQAGSRENAVIHGRAAVAVPYSPEFATVKDDEGLLRQIAARSKGRVISEDQLAQTDLYHQEGLRERRKQEAWHWLLFTAAVLLFFDVALRRIALDPIALATKVVEAWQKRRARRTITEESQSYFDRLKTRKAAADQQLEQAKAPGSPLHRPMAETSPTPPASVTNPPPMAGEVKPPPVLSAQATEHPTPPQTTKASDDFAARLLQAKKKAREKLAGEENQD